MTSGSSEITTRVSVRESTDQFRHQPETKHSKKSTDRQQNSVHSLKISNQLVKQIKDTK